MEASNGKHIKALEVFTHSIKYLHTRAVEVIRERTGDENFSSADVQWVITVPAIWKPAAKQFMREAAYQVRHFISICNFRLFQLNSTNHASLSGVELGVPIFLYYKTVISMFRYNFCKV